VHHTSFHNILTVRKQAGLKSSSSHSKKLGCLNTIDVLDAGGDLLQQQKRQVVHRMEALARVKRLWFIILTFRNVHCWNKIRRTTIAWRTSCFPKKMALAKAKKATLKPRTKRVYLTVRLLPKQATDAANFGRKGIRTKLHNFV
jgi:hypothetical protein